ncbi:MAG: site-specific integrase [Polyangia bacterium]|nr:site-specific integrase [Polyangia bacterium]
MNIITESHDNETYEDHIIRLSHLVRHDIREGHAKTPGHIPDVIEWTVASSPWVATKGEEQVEYDVLEQLDDLIFDEDAFDLLCAQGGIEAPLADLVSFFEVPPGPWWDQLNEVEWVWCDEDGHWHGPEAGGYSLTPEDDSEATRSDPRHPHSCRQRNITGADRPVPPSTTTLPLVSESTRDSDTRTGGISMSETSSAIVPVDLVAQARDFASASRAPSTLRGYQTCWHHFSEWCSLHGFRPLPALPEVVALYLTDRARTLRPQSLGKYLSAISVAHKTAGYDSPTCNPKVGTLLQGIRRTLGCTEVGKDALLVPDLRRILDACPQDQTLGLRDRALILLGFASAMRRSEIVSLDVGDVSFGTEGVTIHLRRSKTDQEGHGRRIGIPHGTHPDTCPCLALRAWLDSSGVRDGPLLRGVTRHGHVQPGRMASRTVARAVQRRASEAGLDPDRFGAHSLRSGFATSAAMAGVSERQIARQTGHQSMSVLRRYIRDGSIWRDNAAAQLGL